MPYIFDPATWSSIWYPEGSPPPVVDKDAEPGSRIGQKFEPGSAPTGATVELGNSDPVPSESGNASAATADKNAQNNAYEYLRRMFEGYGLGTLAPKILEMVQKGYDGDTIALMLQDTQEYKERFKANEERRKKGINVLSPGEYIALERQYRQLLSTAGLPDGFFDQNDDFTNWIAGDVSPAEVQERVGMASQALYNSDPYYIQNLRSFGLGDGDMVAYMLDSKRALPLLQKTVKAAQIGAEASRNSLGIDKARAEMFADLGVSQEQARSAYQQIADILPTTEKLGKIHGEDFGQSDLENEILGGSGLASQKRKRLAAKEASLFSGQSGMGRGALTGRTRGEY
jgi:hypothetical protein